MFYGRLSESQRHLLVLGEDVLLDPDVVKEEVPGYTVGQGTREGTYGNKLRTVEQHKDSIRSRNKTTEEEFIEEIDLTDEKLLNTYNLKIDGRSLSEIEAKGLIAYIRSLRQM